MENKELILKAIDNGFYYKNKNEVYYTPYAVYVGKTYNGSFILTRNTNNGNERSFDWDKDLNFYIKDYGKTWALTEEELGVKSKVWKPVEGETYYYMTANGYVWDTVWFNANADDDIYSIGNCFKTEKECEFAIERLKVIAELERFAEENNKTINWHTYQDKWYFAWYHIGNQIVILQCDTDQHNDIYFDSFELAQRALNEIGRERIKKYYLKVED